MGALPFSVTQKRSLVVFMSRNRGMGTAAISERDRPHRVPRRVTFTDVVWSQPWREMPERQQRSEDSSQTWQSPLRTVTAGPHYLGDHLHVHAGLEMVVKFMQTALEEADARQEVDTQAPATIRTHPISRASPTGTVQLETGTLRTHLAVQPASGFVTNMPPPVALAAPLEKRPSNNGVTSLRVQTIDRPNPGWLAAVGVVGLIAEGR